MSSDLGVIVAGAIGPWAGTQPPKLHRQIGPIFANITIEERHTDTQTITRHPVESGAAISDHAYKEPKEVTIRCAWSNSTDAATPNTITGTLATALGNAAAGSVQAQLASGAQKAIGGSAIGNLAVGQLSDVFGSDIVAIGTQFNTGTGKGTTTVQDVYDSLLALQTSAIPIEIFTGKFHYTSMLIKRITVETTIRSENSLEVVLECQQVILVFTSVQAITADADAQTTPEQTQPVNETGTKNAAPVNPDPGTPLANGIQNYVEPYSAPFNPAVEVTTVNAEGFIPD